MKVKSRTQPRCNGIEADLELLIRCQQGDREALENLCELHYGLIAFWARKLAERYYWTQFDPEDIAQDGMMGFIKAAEEYNPDKYPDFHLFAKLHFIRAVHAGRELQRVPRYQRENKKKVTKAHDQLVMELDRKPTVEEISVKAGLTVKQVQNVLDTADPFHRDLQDLTEGELPETPAPQTDIDPAQSQRVENAINQLDSADARVIRLYYYYDLTDEKVGAQLGLVKDTAKRKRYRALEKLKRIISDAGR